MSTLKDRLQGLPLCKGKERVKVGDIGSLYDGARMNPLTGDFDIATSIGCNPEEGVPACVSILAASSCPQSKEYGG